MFAQLSAEGLSPALMCRWTGRWTMDLAWDTAQECLYENEPWLARKEMRSSVPAIVFWVMTKHYLSEDIAFAQSSS